MATLPELPESEASGEIARIYDEIRVYCAVPYVSSMQRHMATRPGCLEWAWSAVRPRILDGTISETAWRLAGEADLPELPPVARPALRVWGVDAEAEAAIRGICRTFMRVSPINLLFGGILRRLLEGERPRDGGTGAAGAAWTPPAMTPQPPPFADTMPMDPDRLAVLELFRTSAGATTFIPGLYRLLANWPGYLAHSATVLAPVLGSEGLVRECDALAARIDAAAPAILDGLPPLDPTMPAPDAATAADLVTAIVNYRRTSPQMVNYSAMLLAALPEQE